MRWPLQPLQPLQKAQLQQPFGPSVDLLCHPCITTTHLSYSVQSYPWNFRHRLVRYYRHNQNEQILWYTGKLHLQKWYKQWEKTPVIIVLKNVGHVGLDQLRPTVKLGWVKFQSCSSSFLFIWEITDCLKAQRSKLWPTPIYFPTRYFCSHLHTIAESFL